MPFPVSTIAGVSATGDLITGPGFPCFLVNGLPVACMGDTVTGAVCTGAITVSMHPTYLVGGRPVASLTSMVAGVNPATGVPVATAEAITVGINFLV